MTGRSGRPMWQTTGDHPTEPVMDYNAPPPYTRSEGTMKTSRETEPDWEPTLPPGRLGVNFRLPLAIICVLRGDCCRHSVMPHPEDPGNRWYCARCGRRRDRVGAYSVRNRTRRSGDAS